MITGNTNSGCESETAAGASAPVENGAAAAVSSPRSAAPEPAKRESAGLEQSEEDYLLSMETTRRSQAMTWTMQQEAAIKDVKAWMLDPNSSQIFRLFGYAGVGKTTLARDFAAGVKKRVLFGAFTGKAALVLRRKGCEGARTIHSMIYDVDDKNESQPKFILNPGSDVADAGLVIIDECSMVDADLARDLLSFGTKVLVLGDPAQLPPVKGAGYFTDAKPDVMLTEVHRQARDSPIIAMSMTIREGGKLEVGDYGSSRVIPKSAIDAEAILKTDQVIVGLNKTRQTYNRRIRTLLGREGDKPAIGDKLVCLRNNRDRKLLNGGLWTVQKVLKPKGPIQRLQIIPEDEQDEPKPTGVSVREEFFLGTEGDLPWEDKRGTQEFTYGSALTVHKSQGSQWNDIVVFDESAAFREHRARHLYTAITRAAERVTVVLQGS